MFITPDDYPALLRNEIKRLLLEDDIVGTTKLRSAEQMAIAQIRNYLSGRYDVDAIFNKTGDERNSHIIMIVIDCAVYHLYTSVIPDKMSEIRSQRYGDAIEWLKSVTSGKTIADLPKITDEDGSHLIGVKITSKYKPSNQRW